jgi:hypothetical protein
MIAADALRGIAVAMLAALIAMNVATVLAIAACAFAIVAGVVFHSAASEAIIADLTRRDSHQLHLINGRLQSVSTAGRQLAGPPAGSWSYSIAPWLPFAANAVSFFVSAALIGLVPQAGRAAEARTGMWASLKQGASYLAAHRKLRLLAVLTGAANLSFNAGMATLVLYVTDAGGLSMTIAQYGLLLAAMAVGGLIGGLAAARILVRLGDNLVFVGGMFAEALAWILLLTAGSAWVAGAAISMMGFVVALKSVVIMGARQRLVPTEMLGRVISAYRVIGNGTAPAGALLGGLAGTAWGLRAPMLLAAGVVAVGGVFALRAFEPRESEHDNIR